MLKTWCECEGGRYAKNVPIGGAFKRDSITQQTVGRDLINLDDDTSSLQTVPVAKGFSIDFSNTQRAQAVLTTRLFLDFCSTNLEEVS